LLGAAVKVSLCERSELSGVVVVGDNKPDHTFDFYLLHDMETLALYEQGKRMAVKRYQLAQRVIDWQTYMQTGPGLDFAWA